MAREARQLLLSLESSEESLVCLEKDCSKIEAQRDRISSHLKELEACTASQRLASEAAKRQRDELKSLFEELEEESLKIRRAFKKEDEAERCALRRAKRRDALAALRKDVALLARPSEAPLSAMALEKAKASKALKELQEMQRMIRREGMRASASASALRELWKKSEVSVEEIWEAKRLKEAQFDEEICKAKSEALKLREKVLQRSHMV